jgi:diguanylate cyclase (GGDEF)-like protein/PAS domain S-box-containing protein
MAPVDRSSREQAEPDTAERYRLLFDRNPQPMWVYDMETLRFLAVNDAAVGHYGYRRAEFLEMTIRDIRPAEDVEALEQSVPDSSGPSGSGLWRHRKKDGTIIEVDVLSDDLPFAGRRGRLVAATDVTERNRAQTAMEQRAAEQETVAALGAQALEGVTVSELVDEAVSLVAETLGVEFVDLLEPSDERDALCLRAGVGWEEGLVRRAVLPMGSGFQPGFTWGSLGHVLVTDFANEKRFAITPLQRDHGVASSASVIVGRRARPFAVLGVHSSAPGRFGAHEVNFLKAVANILAEAMFRQSSDDQIRHQALHDGLTGLPNRTLLLERLNHWLDRAGRTGGRAALLFLDLDHFKVVNDGLGHNAGDSLLLAVAERLVAALRPSDTVARVGGDEFVLLCEDIASEPAALELVERITLALDDPFTLDGHQRVVTASIGIALAREGTDPEALLRNADAAMYRAKERGRARFELFDEAMRERSLRWLEVERDLRSAIDRREFHNLYQPIVDGRERVVGFEALVRWTHPEHGLLPPAEFIPVADQSGLIVPIGQLVLRAACEEAKHWPLGRDGQPLKISVNLSPRQVSHPALVEGVAEILEETGLDPGRLDLEITETVLIEDTEMALEALTDLKALGVGLVLDDFGTGYSSLAYVRRFPIDMLKIDRSFVDGLADGNEDAAIVSAVISMGQALRVDVLAEGVETSEQARQLRTLGCEFAQGYLYAKPLGPESIAGFLDSPPSQAEHGTGCG